MSVYIIYYENGAKKMRPVKDRKEYMALRDSDENRKAEKQRMVQMNYSCLPNEDGSLKGATRASSTVGMDIDFDPTAPDYKDKMAQMPAMVTARKDELGLLMLERSATKGYHMVFRRKPGMSQEECLRWASTLLGVEYDRGAKDITRVFYTPADKLIYLDDAIFDIEEATLVAAKAEVKTEVKQAEEEPVAAEQTSLIAFDLCVEEAGLNAGEMDVWGKHNWHANLMAVLSVGLPKLMSKQQLMAVIAAKLPNYSQTEDCQKLINYFYDNYTADKGFMSVTLRDINARAQKMASQQASSQQMAHAEMTDSETDHSDIDAQIMESLTEGWNPPVMPKKLPRVLELAVKNFDPRFREMLAVSAMPTLAAHASHFRGRYINGKIVGPQLYVAVIGGSGQGKGCCTDLYNNLVEHTLLQHDKAEWKKYEENKELREQEANAKKRPLKYHPQLRLFENASKTSILDLQSNLGDNGMLLGQYSEVDSLVGASQANYSDLSVILRKAWDGDILSQYYMSDSSCSTSVRMNVSLLMSGTPKAMLTRMFNDQKVENGFMQRCIPVLAPRRKRTFRPPVQNFLSQDEQKELNALVMQLYQKDLALGDDTKVLELPMTCRAIEKWFDELEVRYNDGKLTEAEADLSHRCGEFMFRTALTLVAENDGKETKEIVDFARYVGELAHYNMCRIFGSRVQRDILDSQKMLDQCVNDSRKTAEPLLDKLPNVFTIKDFKEVRRQNGQSTDVRMLLSRYCKNGKLERIGKGVYSKVSVDRIVDDQPSSDTSAQSA